MLGIDPKNSVMSGSLPLEKIGVILNLVHKWFQLQSHFFWITTRTFKWLRSPLSSVFEFAGRFPQQNTHVRDIPYANGRGAFIILIMPGSSVMDLGTLAVAGE